MPRARAKPQPAAAPPPSLASLPDEDVRGRYTAVGYRTARTIRAEGRTSAAASGRQHLMYDRRTLVDQARELARDHGIFEGMIERAVNYIVGNGWGLQARTKSEKWNRDAERLWRDRWTHGRPEIKGVLDGGSCERMVCRELLTVGETATLKVEHEGQPCVQIVESEQLTGRGQALEGYEADAYGRPTKWYVAPYGAGGVVQPSKAQPYTPPGDILYMADPKRPSAVRAAPPCQAAFAMLHRISDVCDSEAISWQLLARLAISVTREGAEKQAWAGSKADPLKTGDTAGQVSIRVQEFDYATIFHGPPGAKIAGIDHNLPGANFPASLTMFMRLLGLPLGLPLEVVLLDWTKSNYSQSRAVLEQAYQTFLRWQQLIEHGFLRPVYDWYIEQWIAAGDLGDRGDATAAEWIKPTFPWLDQYKEAQAYGMQVDRGFATHASVCKGLGGERSDIVDAREAEIRDAIARATKIKADTGVRVPWELFSGNQYSQIAESSRVAAEGRASEDQQDKQPDDEQEQPDDADD